MPQSFTIYIDDEPYQPPEKKMTANEILALADIDPDNHYLEKIKRADRTSFKGKGNEEIDLYEGDKFIGQFCGPTQVSEC